MESIGNQIKELINKSHLIFKIEEKTLKFYYYKNTLKKPIFLRSFIENNFKLENRFYTGIEKASKWINGDYDFVANKIM